MRTLFIIFVIILCVGIAGYAYLVISGQAALLTGGPYANLEFDDDGTITNAPVVTEEIEALCDKELFRIVKQPDPVRGFAIAAPEKCRPLICQPAARGRYFDFVEIEYTPEAEAVIANEISMEYRDYGFFRVTRRPVDSGLCSQQFMRREAERRSRRIPEPREFCLVAEKIPSFSAKYILYYSSKKQRIGDSQSILETSRYWLEDRVSGALIAESLSYYSRSPAWSTSVCRGPESYDFVKRALSSKESDN